MTNLSVVRLLYNTDFRQFIDPKLWEPGPPSPQPSQVLGGGATINGALMQQIHEGLGADRAPIVRGLGGVSPGALALLA